MARALPIAGSVVLMAASADAAESRSFVLGWLGLATHPVEGDCPGGVAADSAYEILRLNLRLAGKSPAEVDEIANAYRASLADPFGGAKFREYFSHRGQINGKPVDVYMNPMAAKDPHLSGVYARLQYGFDLDGKGAAGPDAFEDPDTHEAGVDNQLVRAVGCIPAWRHDPGQGTSPDSGFFWSEGRATNRAWVVTVTGEDLGRDGDVTLTLQHSLDHVGVNTKGEVQADMTFRISPDSRMQHNIYHGKLKNGVVTTAEPVDFYMLSEPGTEFGYTLYRSKVRLSLRPNASGAVRGLIGGYRPWREIYAPYVVPPGTFEQLTSVNVVGLFYNMRRYADALPDPVTGQNQAISAAYLFEAVPAFVVPATQAPERVAASAP